MAAFWKRGRQVRVEAAAFDTGPILGKAEGWFAEVESSQLEVDMTVFAKSLGIDKLDVDDRLALVEEIWASIAADAKAFPLTPAQRDELDRRVADDSAYPSDVIPWSEVKASVRARLGR